MGSQNFCSLSPDEQVEKLETLARKALDSWGLDHTELWLLKYRENCVFGVYEMETGTKYALRIHRPGYHSDAALNSELKWMEALHAEGIPSPEVIHTSDQKLMVSVKVDEVPEPRVRDLLGWIEGGVLGNIEGGDTASADEVKANYRMAGQIAARIHNQAEHWHLPDGFQRQIMDGEGLVGKSGYFGDFRTHPDLTLEQLNLLKNAADIVSRDLERFGKTPDKFGLTHADFLPENLLIKNNRVRIIDFDDCGFGWYMMDIATALYFLRGEESYDVAREGLIEGYRSERALPEEHLSMLPVCFMARVLAYVGWAVTRHETETAQELSAMLIEDATTQAEAYLK